MPFVFKSKWFYLAVAIGGSIQWYRLFKMWKEMSAKLNWKNLHYKYHNCIIMYSTNGVAKSWQSPSMVQLDNMNLRLFEPILYFISTANKSLDIILMVISVDCVIRELIKAHKRNVKLRILLNYNNNSKSAFKMLKKIGININCFINYEMYSILHSKYMIKDYKDGEGYICMGSLNWTVAAVQNNYENLILLMNPSLAKALHHNFQEVYGLVNKMNADNFYLNTVL